METPSELRQQLLERLRGGALAPAAPAADLPIPSLSGEELPLSPGQQQLWLHSQLAPDAPIYNESITVRKKGSLDPGVLEAAFNEVVRRHATWRTGFQEVSGHNTQVVNPHIHIPLPLIDLAHLPFEAAEAEAIRMATDDARALFNLRNAPLLRARLVRLAPDDHRIYLTFHHLVFDGVSVYRVFLPELAGIYRRFLAGLPSGLPDLTIQYGDYAAWQQRKLARGDYAQQLNYWRDNLRVEASPVELPVSQTRPATPTWRAGMEVFTLAPGLSKAVKHLAAMEGASVYMALLAAFQILLHRYSGQTEITTGGVMSVRNRPEVESLVGYLLNTVVLRSVVDPSLTFREFLGQVRNTVLNTLENSDVPFHAVVRELAPKRDASRNALFQILFSLRPQSAELADGWSLKEFDVHSGASGFDLFADLIEGPENLTGRLIYSSELFEPAMIRQMIGHLNTLLEGITRNPDSPIALLPLLPDMERAALLSAGTGVSVDRPPATLAGLLEEAASKSPQSIAATFEDQQLTYQALDRRASEFAAQLREAGAGPGALVAVSVERSLELLIALVGVLKTGAAYLPIDPGFPAERQEFIIRDANPHLCVTTTRLDMQTRHRDRLDFPPGLAYVLYTSGSTGVPKGVAVPESAVVNLLNSMQREPGFSAADSLLAVTTLSFDIAALEIFLPLVSRGTVVVAPSEVVKDPQRLLELMAKSKCSVMQGTPALWRSLVDAGWRGDAQLKVFCGGEALSRALANDLVSRCGELWNLYGPTETTIWSLIQKVEHGRAAVPIGKPIDNTQVYVLDRQMQLLPAGITGELYIGGSGVARGYVGRPSLTEERFLPDPFRPDARVYRTGDLARWNHGSLEFLGRADNQVKVRGYRVELQEIEEALVQFPGVRAAAVKAWPDASGENSLVAYVEGACDAQALRRYLSDKLPDYMVPSRYREEAALPRTANGKLDRKRLAEPSRANARAVEPSEPRNDIERRLAAIWAELLSISDPGVHQDFFELGGHSLLAASLLRRIESAFDKRLNMSVLFENPTIAGLAGLLTPDANRAADSETRRICWVYAGAKFRNLAASLRPDCRLESVYLPDQVEAGVRLSDNLEDVAGLVVKELRMQHPKGPYSLGGWCVAGILAYEVAVQLEALGEQVAFVTLLGAPNPRHYAAVARRDRLKNKLQHHWKHLTNLDVAGVQQYLLQRARHQIGWRNPLHAAKFDRILLQLALRYQPTPLRAPLVLIQSMDRPPGVDYAPGWAGLVAGEFTAFEVPGNHSTSLEEPHVAVLADQLRACFR